MTVAKRYFDRKEFPINALAVNASVNCDVPIPTDTVVILKATFVFGHIAGGHISAGGSIYSEFVVKNVNGAVSPTTTQLGSGGGGPPNPYYAMTTADLGGGTAFGATPTALWQTGGASDPNARLVVNLPNVAGCTLDGWVDVEMWILVLS